MAQRDLPTVPVKHSGLVQYLQSHPDKPIRDLLNPYNDFDAVLRQIFAQRPDHPAIADGLVNVVPLYDTAGDGTTNLQIRARDLATESNDVKSKYIMPLADKDRRPNGSPAVVQSLKEFQTNFNIFSEGSLAGLNWDNVLAVGSSVATALLPLPADFALADSKRKIRQFYHEQLAPASDVDLFLYGLDYDQAIEKIKHIERCINDSVLTETTTVRTKHAITIVSQYPTRHVQIVLRLYKSPAEILTGLDVDCSAVAYNGRQVYFTPRALGAYITQVNNIDLSRRSPSYESRLSKYSRRGFEAFWPDLDRSRIDPTIFERNLKRIVGLARLLVLEKLPLLSDREIYQEQRRSARGRPAIKGSRQYNLPGNLKDEWDDEIPDWMEGDEISNYHTIKIPYGKKYYARKIEKILFTKDLLLNAEWNRPADRMVNLHRHPAFFGGVDDALHDCCGYCPVPSTDEEKKVSDEESKTFITGNVTFLTDNPGRQEIGSFNPITEGDWADMAYLGDSEGLSQAIVDQDLGAVRQWVAKGVDVNRRDHTGRTPLHLAAMASTPEILQYLIDNGARITWRLADGRSALHLAAARGNVEMIRSLMRKSEQNEEEETPRHTQQRGLEDGNCQSEPGTEEDLELISNPLDNSSTYNMSYTTGSFVKVNPERPNEEEQPFAADSNLSDPDIYDINAVDWDINASPLHLAIMKGQVEAVEELASSFGANVLLPLQSKGPSRKSGVSTTLTLVLALALPLERAKDMTAKLLQLGASPAQSDIEHKTPVFYAAAGGHLEILELYVHHDKPAVIRALKPLSATETGYRTLSVDSPLTAAIGGNHPAVANRLLQLGAHPSISFKLYMSASEGFSWVRSRLTTENRTRFEETFDQPVVYAVQNDLPLLAMELSTRGADPNTLTREGHIALGKSYYSETTEGQSVLDCVRAKLASLREYKGEPVKPTPPTPLSPDDQVYLAEFEPGTYQHLVAKGILTDKREKVELEQQEYEEALETARSLQGLEEKRAVVKQHIEGFEKLELDLLKRGAKSFKELHPNVKARPRPDNTKSSTTPASPFRIVLDFKRHDLTEEKRLDYLKLFEAAWIGDVTTIKQLTMTVPDGPYHRPPLEIAVCDTRGYSAFTIAVLRGHLDVADAILAIAAAQYKPAEEPKARYHMPRYESDDDASTASDIIESHDVQLQKEVIEPQFTIENVGQIQTEAESKTNPVSILDEECDLNLFLKGPTEEAITTLVGYAIWTDDTKLLNFLITRGQQLNERFPEDPDEFEPYGVYDTDFLMAIRLGRLHCVEILIRRTGAGLDLDVLIEENEIEAIETPGQYRGLSVRGKRHTDWASRNRTALHSPTAVPPLLRAARTGNLESVQWFLGPAAPRCYITFATNNKHDNRVQQLVMAKKGLEQTITDFLDARRHLVLHCAIVSAETEGSLALVEYLASMPALLESKSVDGLTPLAVAFRLGRRSFAQALIKAGADQTVRDKHGRNLLHFWLEALDLTPSTREAPIRDMLSLIDARLLPSILTERCPYGVGSLTPFALWISRLPSGCPSEKAFRELASGLDFIESLGYKHLELLDGAGNTPAHNAARDSSPQLTDLLLKYRPQLTAKENINGFTPADLAEQKWFASASKPPDARKRPWSRDLQASAAAKAPRIFVENSQPVSALDKKRIVYERYYEKGRKSKTGRKLVTLFEVNEATSASYNTFRKRQQPWRARERDEVSNWLSL
ncbi:ankyrin repeat-containing domain protein [Aspergillus pseudoustus]|uniref:Ankyrin repeat-containing domain protein n=1 Tax=Aspergillus pseudoustus TaxID=1810923 RepID=A0ABR4J1T8_9EURO